MIAWWNLICKPVIFTPCVGTIRRRHDSEAGFVIDGCLPHNGDWRPWREVYHATNTTLKRVMWIDLTVPMEHSA